MLNVIFSKIIGPDVCVPNQIDVSHNPNNNGDSMMNRLPFDTQCAAAAAADTISCCYGVTQWTNVNIVSFSST